MIVGTAGHIDHGKTTLTRALTGIDTDRLKEEKERGISIELGYAYAPLPSGAVLGVIDVPGHEKFIRTMASGVTGIDLALLVIAADDGVMPQTVEHLAILQLLGVRRAAVVLTKTDRADAGRIAAVSAEAGNLLAATPFAAAPLFPTQATVPGDPGVAALREWLDEVAQALPGRDEQRLFRLGVDRVFTLTGQGTVVTGTALSGSAAPGDVLTLMPSGLQVRVRGVHAQNRAAERGFAGQRLALNLAGVARDEVARGDWLVSPPLAEPTERIDVSLSVLADAGAALGTWQPLHVHLGAAHRTAHIVPLEEESIAPGSSARAQLVFEQPLHAAPGDRFVLRNAQATRTIGGGVVLDPWGAARKRRSPARLAWLDALAIFTGAADASAGAEHTSAMPTAGGAALRPLIAASPSGIARSLLSRLTLRAAAQLAAPEGAMQLPLPDGDALFIGTDQLEALRQRVIAGLERFHATQPDEAGPELWRLKRMVLADASDGLWSGLVAGMLEAGVLKQTGHSLHLPAHSTALTDAEQAQAERLLEQLCAGRFDPPWVRDLASRFAMPEGDVRKLLRKLARAGQVSQVVPDLFYHPQPLAELAQIVSGLQAAQAANFRDATALGRKRAIQILEFFDRVGYTRRVRDTHLLRPNARWPGIEL